ncbi:POC1 centriolar protein homolog A-like [Cydia amplana]|uniref:POC1 centriolar protein homolog A-like n=1 Tax=Cydia amplana TaxID=1869771 RepID=UPI002FE56FEA
MEEESTLVEPSLDKQLKGHKNAITSLYYNVNEHQIATGSLDNSILLWQLHGCMKSYRFQGHSEAVMDVTFSPSGKHMASASRDKTVRLWVPTVTGSTGFFKAHSQTVRSVQFTPDESKILTASDDKIIKLWSSDRYKFISSFVGHKNWVRCARISNDGCIIASCSDDKTSMLWDPESGKEIHTYKDQKGFGMCLAWHPSGCYIAVGTSQGNVKLYDVRSHNLVQYYSIHSDAVTQLSFHPSGSYILTASKDGKMKILDLLEGHPLFTLTGHTGSVNAVNFSPSGDTFASAGEDKQVLLWNTNFTEVSNEMKENMGSQRSKSATSVKGKKQGTKIWYLCYHSCKYPETSFVHIDPPESTGCETNDCQRLNVVPQSTHTSRDRAAGLLTRNSSPSSSARSVIFRGQPRANSTILESGLDAEVSQNSNHLRSEQHTTCKSDECDSVGTVGDMSHIPRVAPSRTTYTVPCIASNNTFSVHTSEEDMFGMIKLKENDVCYTSGTIEWVGRKRSFPINSGFKLLNDTFRHEPLVKKVKSDVTYTCNGSHLKDCDCADVLPTMNAIVDHLNALHEAVDLVDLRVNTLENAL